jgi:hypothetical protein
VVDSRVEVDDLATRSPFKTSTLLEKELEILKILGECLRVTLAHASQLAPSLLSSLLIFELILEVGEELSPVVVPVGTTSLKPVVNTRLLLLRDGLNHLETDCPVGSQEKSILLNLDQELVTVHMEGIRFSVPLRPFGLLPPSGGVGVRGAGQLETSRSRRIIRALILESFESLVEDLVGSLKVLHLNASLLKSRDGIFERRFWRSLGVLRLTSALQAGVEIHEFDVCHG